MNDCEKAKQILEEKNISLVLCRGDDIVESDKRGVAPMLGFIGEKRNLAGYSAADKIVGKAAALLFVLSGVTCVYAEVLSKTAVKIFEEYGIEYSFGTLCDNIENRDKTGICPMEQTVENTDDPNEAYSALVQKVASLRAGGKQ